MNDYNGILTRHSLHAGIILVWQRTLGWPVYFFNDILRARNGYYTVKNIYKMVLRIIITPSVTRIILDIQGYRTATSPKRDTSRLGCDNHYDSVYFKTEILFVQKGKYSLCFSMRCKIMFANDIKKSIRQCNRRLFTLFWKQKKKKEKKVKYCDKPVNHKIMSNNPIDVW